MSDARFSFHRISVPGANHVEIALPVDSTDPVVSAYRNGEALNGYLTEWLRRFSHSGDFVLDLGCHVGTTSIPAAALGRRVLAVDASTLHVDGVRLAAARNGFDNLRVERCAVAASEGQLAFLENGLWGRVMPGAAATDGSQWVPARRADSLLEAHGWEQVDFVKIDIEGSELAAIVSLGRYLDAERAPVIVYESNGMTFELFGYSIAHIRARLEALGYETYRFEPEGLVYCPPHELQPEAWLDVVALPARWRRGEAPLMRTWARGAMVERCLTWGGNEHRNVRQYLHRALSADRSSLGDDAQIARLRTRLADEFGTL